MEYLEMDTRHDPPSQAAMDEFIPGVIRRSMTPEWMKRVPAPNLLANAMASPAPVRETTVHVAAVEVAEAEAEAAAVDDLFLLATGRVDLEAQKVLPPRLEDAAFLPANTGSTSPVPAPPKSWMSWLFRY